MKWLFFLLIVLPSCFSFAQVCKDKKQTLELSNSSVPTWKEFMEPKFQTRALIQGVIVSLIEDRQGHMHWEVDLDRDLTSTDDRIEVIYNIKYGALENWQVGDTLTACGDFIKDSYSPMGAVIHWLHKNEKPKNGHDDGFLIINGKVYGN